MPRSFLRCALLCAALLVSPLAPAQQPPVRIAAAADLAPCIDRLNTASGIGATATIGASGSFYAQIRNGAPYDVFLSADTAYPRALAEAGQADPASLFVYAHGRLALWAAAPGIRVDGGLRLLTDPSIRRIAIANPEVAPYGKAAKAALQRAGLWEQLQGKLVFGETSRRPCSSSRAAMHRSGWSAAPTWRAGRLAGCCRRTVIRRSSRAPS